MKYITVKEAAEKWGYCEATVRKWCKAGKIKVSYTAEKKKGRWRIPADAECPSAKKKK